MARGNFHAIFDAGTYEQFMRIVGKGNIAKNLESYMMNVISVNQQDTNGINIQLIIMEIEKLQKEINEKQAQLNSKLQLKSKYEDNITEMNRKRLEIQKVETERLSKCQNCGQILADKMQRHRFPIGPICNACFLTADKEGVAKWNSKEIKQQTETG